MSRTSQRSPGRWQAYQLCRSSYLCGNLDTACNGRYSALYSAYRSTTRLTVSTIVVLRIQTVDEGCWWRISRHHRNHLHRLLRMLLESYPRARIGTPERTAAAREASIAASHGIGATREM